VSRPHQSKRRTARLIADARAMCEGYGIAWDSYNGTTVTWWDDPERDASGPVEIRLLNESGACNVIHSIWAGDDGEILQSARPELS
jgi:hypothetical protein